MNLKTKLSSLAASLCLAGALHAQTDTLRVFTAVELEYQTVAGQVYTLQGSLDLTTWVDIGNPIYGNGQTVSQIFSTKDTNTVNYATYRLAIVPAPTNGFAPWSVAGVNIQMDDSSSSNLVQYLSETDGQDVYAAGNDPFTYTFARTSRDGTHVERTYSPRRRDVIDYTYSSTNSGSWVREEYERDVLKGRHVGMFRYAGQIIAGTGSNPPVVVVPTLPPAPPAALAGLTYYTFTGPTPDKYTFNTNGNGGMALPGSSSGEVEISSSFGNQFTYSYTVLSSNTASLTVNFGYYGIGGDRQEYDLQFNDGPSALFTRRIYRLGSLFTTDHGVFTPNAVITPAGGTTNPPVVSTNPPPASPAGYTYTMNFSGTPPRVVFQTATAGTEFDNSAPSTFTYTYAATGANTYHVVVTFKADKWDEYDLTFADGISGSLTVKRYDKNTLKRTDSGTFTIAPTTP